MSVIPHPAVRCGECGRVGYADEFDCIGLDGLLSCPWCGEHGGVVQPMEPVDCPSCGGAGRIDCDTCDTGQVDCGTCLGTGLVLGDLCNLIQQPLFS